MRLTLKMKTTRARPTSAGRYAKRPRQMMTSPNPMVLYKRPVLEKNYVDLAANAYALNTTGSITLIATIAQGASVNQRIGKKCYLRSLQCRGNAYGLATTTATDAAYLIVYDKRPSGSLPAITDVLDSASPASMNNDNNASRFSILKRVDLTIIGSAANQFTSSSAFGADWFLNLRGLPMTFNSAGTGAIGDIDEGALYLITIGGGAGTAAAELGVTLRTRFTEM